MKQNERGPGPSSFSLPSDRLKEDLTVVFIACIFALQLLLLVLVFFNFVWAYIPEVLLLLLLLEVMMVVRGHCAGGVGSGDRKV